MKLQARPAISETDRLLLLRSVIPLIAKIGTQHLSLTPARSLVLSEKQAADCLSRCGMLVSEFSAIVETLNSSVISGRLPTTVIPTKKLKLDLTVLERYQALPPANTSILSIRKPVKRARTGKRLNRRSRSERPNSLFRPLKIRKLTSSARRSKRKRDQHSP